MAEADSKKKNVPRPISLSEAVTKKVEELQRRATADTRDADVVARLARLRRAVSAEPGEVPEVWDDTIEILSQTSEKTGAANSSERAAHVAVTLYALHQQGKGTPVHKRGDSLGTAARALAIATDREDAIRSRFQAIALADTHSGIDHHLRAMIKLLRTADIPLDYGKLADDLRILYGRTDAHLVRLQWGRAFSRKPKSDKDSSTNDTAITES